MADSSSRKAVVAAIGANSIIMIAKFIGYAITGSGSMLGEAVHTTADLLNQILLLVGIERSKLPPTPEHPYGYKAESFVWALISAVGIFFLGCGVTVYHGVHTLLHPQPIEFSWIAVGILAFGFVIDGVVLWVAYKGLKDAAGDRPFFNYLMKDADPTAMAVLLEDSVASLGIIIALAGLLLSSLTGNPVWDSLGTLSIGLMLGFVAVYLVWRNRSYLVGRSAPVDMIEKFEGVLADSPVVENYHDVKSRLHSTDQARFKVEVDFDGRYLASKLEPYLREHHGKVEDWEAFERFAGEFADRILDVLGDEVDDLERKVREAIPEARHVDIEND